MLHYRYKSLVTTRESFRKPNELEKWENIIFHSISLPHSRKKRISSESEAVSVSLITLPDERKFSEDVTVDSRKHILECNLSTSRSRLAVLLEHIHFLAERENITLKQLVALSLQLVSNETHDRETSNVCKEIVDKGSYSDVLHRVSLSKSAYLSIA